MQEWSVPAWAVGAAALLVVLAVTGAALAVARVRRRAARELEQARADAAELRERVAGIERQLARRPVAGGDPAPEPEFVITHLGDPEPAPTVDAPLFADLLLRESVVQAASLAAGLRRALSAETRNRIRFEMRREVKRARKQRRADLKQARREWEARQRDALPVDDVEVTGVTTEVPTGAAEPAAARATTRDSAA